MNGIWTKCEEIKQICRTEQQMSHSWFWSSFNTKAHTTCDPVSYIFSYHNHHYMTFVLKTISLVSLRWTMQLLLKSFIYLFIEGLQPCQLHRVTSGLTQFSYIYKMSKSCWPTIKQQQQQTTLETIKLNVQPFSPHRSPLPSTYPNRPTPTYTQAHRPTVFTQTQNNTLTTFINHTHVPSPPCSNSTMSQQR